MSDLRSKLIRLAKENPELRGDILPLLNKEAASSFDLAEFKDYMRVGLQRGLKETKRLQKQFEKSYKELLELHRGLLQYPDHQKKLNEAMLGLKEEVLAEIVAEEEALTHDVPLINLMTASHKFDALSVVSKMKSSVAIDWAMYKLKQYK